MRLDIHASDLIKKVYSARLDRDAWDKVLVELLQLMSCAGGVASLIDVARNQPLLNRVYSLDGCDLADEADIYLSRVQLGHMRSSTQDTLIARFHDSRQGGNESHVFFQPSSPRSASAFWYGGFGSPLDGLVLHVAAHFSEEPSNLSQAIGLFEILFDHLECALRVGARPFNSESARAIIRLDSDGHVKQLSKGANRILSERPALRVSQDRLSASRRAEQSSIDRTMARVLGGGTIGANPAAVQIGHENGRPWILVFRPVSANYGPFGVVRRNVDVEVLDHVPMIGSLDVVQSLFDLTARELQVLRLLAEGHSIDSLSATIDVSRNTTRAHLRSIYSKTKTNSQLELMQLSGGLSSVAMAHAESTDSQLVN